MIDLIGFHGIERAFAVEALKLFEQVKVAVDYNVVLKDF